MKATELMINDWVKIDEPDRYAGAIGQIKSLLHHQEDDAAYFHVFIQGTHGYLIKEVCSDDIRPIPLQKVHLAKNGFEPDEKDEVFIYYDGYEVRVDFDDLFDGMIYLNINFAEKSLSKEIVYLHELQQAMRLMDCDKEIVL